MFREWAREWNHQQERKRLACASVCLCECLHGENRLVKWKYIAERWGGRTTVSLFGKSIYFYTAQTQPQILTMELFLSLLVAFRASFLFILLSTEITQYKDELFLWSLYGNKCVTWMCCCCCVRCLLCTALSVHLCCSHFFSFFFFTFPPSSSSSVAEHHQFYWTISPRSKNMCGDVCARSNVTKREGKNTTSNTAKRFYDCFILDCFRACV